MLTQQFGNHMRLGDAARLAIAVELLAQVRRKADGEGHGAGGEKLMYYDNTPNVRPAEEVTAASRHRLETFGRSHSSPFIRGEAA